MLALQALLDDVGICTSEKCMHISSLHLLGVHDLCMYRINAKAGFV